MAANRPGKKKQQAKKKPVDPAVAAAKRERRAQAAALREEQKRRARRRRMLKQVGILAGITAVVVGVSIAVISNRTPDYAAPPPGFDEEGRISIGNADAPVTVTMVEDYSCPHCATKHAETKDLLAGYAAGDDVRVDYRPIAFLDSSASDDYASRALNAAACVVQDDAEHWASFHDALMTNQPPQGSGLSDDQLVDLAGQSGAEGDDVADCITDRDHDDWVEWTTHQAEKDDFQGTPDAFVNGERVDVSAGAIDAAVQESLP